MARFLVEILINAAGGPKARASFDDVGASAASAAKRVEQAGVQSERALRRTAEAAERLQNQMEETKASKGLIADLQAMNRRTQEQVAALRQGAAGLERYQQKELEAAQAARILSAQVRAGVSAHSLAGKEIADQIRLHDRLQAELHETARAQGLASRGTGGGGMSVLVSSARSFMGVAAAATAAVVGIGYSIKHLTDAASESEAVMAQLRAGLISTGGVSGQTVASLSAIADEISRLTGVDDELIASGEAVLLTFTKIAGDVFPRATSAALDMSVRMKTDLNTSILQVGKALNDPVKGVTALTKAGVQFTDAQKGMIKSLVESGDLLGAQTIILKELETQFGGSAAAARDTLGGALTAAKTETGNLIEVLAEGLSPIIRSLTEDYITWTQSAEAQKQMAEWGHLLADSLDAVSSAAKVLGPLIGAIGDQLKITLGGINLALQALGWLAEKVKFAADSYVQLARDAGIADRQLHEMDFGSINVQISDNMSAVYDLRKAYGELGQAAVEAAEKELAAMAASAEALRQRAAQLRKSEAEAKRQAGQHSDERYEAGLGRASGYAKEATEAEYAAKNLDNIVEGLTGRLKKHAEAAGEAAGETGEFGSSLNDAQDSARKLMEELILAEANQRKRTTAAKESTAAHKEETLVQEQAAKVSQIRAAFLKAQIPWTEKNTAAVYALVKSLRDLKTQEDATLKSRELMIKVGVDTSALDKWIADQDALEVKQDQERRQKDFQIRTEYAAQFAEYNAAIEASLEQQAESLRNSLVTPREELEYFRGLIDDLADASKHGGEALLSAAEAERLRAQAAEHYASSQLDMWTGFLSQLGDQLGGFFAEIASLARSIQGVNSTAQSMGGWSSAAGAWGGTIAAFVAAYQYADAVITKHKGEKYGTRSGLSVTGGTDVSSYTTQAGMELSRAIADILKALESQLRISVSDLESIEIRVRNNGKEVQAWVKGEWIGTFTDVNSAIREALITAMADPSSSLQGLSDLMREGIGGWTSPDMEGLFAFLGELREISDLSLSPEVIGLQESLRKFQEMRETLSKLDQSSEAVIDAQLRLTEAQNWLISQTKASLLGIDMSAAEAVRSLAGFQEGMDQVSDAARRGLEAAIAAAERKLAALEKKAGGQPGTPGVLRDPGDSPAGELTEAMIAEQSRLRAAIAEYKKQLGEIPKALSDQEFDLGIFTALEPALRKSGKYAELILKYEQMRVTAQYESLRLQLIAAGAWERWAAVWQDLYNQAIGEAGRPPARGGRGGGGGGKDEVRDFIKDKRFELSLDGLTDYQKALKELDRTYDEELKKAGNDKKLRTELLALKEKELQLLKKEQAASTLQNFREFMGLVTPFDQVRKTAADLIKEIEGSPFGDERKARMIGRVLAEVERQLDALALQSTASLFGEMIGDLEKYGVGEETRAQMRQQMAIIEHQLKLFHYRTEIEILRASGRVSAETLAILDEGLRILEGVDLTAPPAPPAANDNVPRISMEERRKQANDAASKVAKDIAAEKEKAEKEAIDILKKWKDVGRPSIVRDLENLSDELKKVTAVFGETEDVMSAHAQAFSAIIKDYLSPVTDYLKGFDSDPNSSLTGEQQYYRTRDEFRAISQLSPDELMSQLLSGVLDPAAIADLAAQYRERGRGFTAGEGYRAIENEIRTVMESIANLVPDAFSGSPEALQVDFSGMSEVAWKSPEIKGAIEAGNTALLLELRAHNPILRQISAGIGETNRILTSTVFDVRNVA